MVSDSGRAERLRVRRDAKERIHKIQIDRLREAMDAAGTNPSALAIDLKIGHRTYFRDFLSGRKKSISAAVMARVAEHLGQDLAWLSASDQRMPLVPEDRKKESQKMRDLRLMPLLGIATGGSDGRLIFGGEVLDEMPRPPQLEHALNPYAVMIAGESMYPRYKPGEIVYVNTVRPARRGDDVVVQVMENGELSGYVKELVQMLPDKVVVQQFNPAKKMTFRRADVQHVHVIELATR